MSTVINLHGTLKRGGAPLPFCTVTLTGIDNASIVTTTTTGAGIYSLDVPPGDWRVTIQPQHDVPQDIGLLALTETTPPQALDTLLLHLTPETVSTGVLAFFLGLKDDAQRLAQSATDVAGSAAAALASQKAAKTSEDNAAESQTTAGEKADAATRDALRAETARTAAEKAAASVDVHEAPGDGVCYVRRNAAWVRQGAFDVGIADSAGDISPTAHQLFTLDGTKNNTVTFTGLPEGRAMVIALVFKGKGGTVTWPDNLSWSQNDVPKLAETRTVVSILWDGETLTGTTALTV